MRNVKKFLKGIFVNLFVGLTSNVASECIPFGFYQPKAPKSLTKKPT
ncbi:cyclic lactone autoinducer peptide [Pseudobacteroides sp.]